MFAKFNHNSTFLLKFYKKVHLNKNNYKYYADYKKKSKKSYLLLKID